MKSFKKYLEESVERLKSYQAYWQPSGNAKVKEGMILQPYKGGIHKDVEQIFEEERPISTPSRMECFFVAPTATHHLFKGGKPVYEVSVTGKALFANAELFTEAVFSRDEEGMRYYAKEYWKGTKDKNNKYTEIVVDKKGKVEVLWEV